MAKTHLVVDPKNWVYQGRYTCRHCKSVFSPEKGDFGLKIREDEFDCVCPVCDADNRYRRGPKQAEGVGYPADLETHVSFLPGFDLKTT